MISITKTPFIRMLTCNCSHQKTIHIYKQKELAASTSHYGPQGIALSQAMAVRTIFWSLTDSFNRINSFCKHVSTGDDQSQKQRLNQATPSTTKPVINNTLYPYKNLSSKTKAKNLSLTRSFIKALLMEYNHDHSTAESSHARRYLQSEKTKKQ